jgi:S1-C subfamily serine protease
VESLVPTSPTFPTQVVSQSKGRLLDAKQEFLCDCLCTYAGIIVNKHVVADAKWIHLGGKIFPMTKVKQCKIKLHEDLTFCELFDGAPALLKKHFAVPIEIGMKVAVVSTEAMSFGTIAKITADEVEVTASTKPGWCGSPYVDSNGRVIAIHFSAGSTGKTNVGMKVTNELLEVLGQPAKNF